MALTIVLPLPPTTLAPDADALLRLLASTLSSDDLLAIARADYGEDVDAHLDALRRLIRERTLAPLLWEPREVLELTRWDEPPHEADHVRRHWRRAFACTALLRLMTEPENGDLAGSNSTLASLIDSLHALSHLPHAPAQHALVHSLDAAATAFLAWLTPRLVAEETPELAFFGLGLLWSALGTDAPDAGLIALADWVMVAEEDASALPRTASGSPYRWLLDTTSYDLRHHLWEEIGSRLPERLHPRHGTEVSDAVRSIAALLARGHSP